AGPCANTTLATPTEQPKSGIRANKIAAIVPSAATPSPFQLVAYANRGELGRIPNEGPVDARPAGRNFPKNQPARSDSPTKRCATCCPENRCKSCLCDRQRSGFPAPPWSFFAVISVPASVKKSFQNTQ